MRAKRGIFFFFFGNVNIKASPRLVTKFKERMDFPQHAYSEYLHKVGEYINLLEWFKSTRILVRLRI